MTENNTNSTANKIICQCNKCGNVFTYDKRKHYNDKDKIGHCPNCKGSYTTIKSSNSRIDRNLFELSNRFN